MAENARSTGTRRQSDGDAGTAEPANRKLILDSAQRLFADAGFAATSTAKIAAAAGVPHGLVFYYFPTKRHLLLAVVRERAYRGTLGSRVPRGRSAAETLSAAASELAEVFTRNRDTQVILFREAGTDPELHQLVTALVASSTGDVATLLAGASDAPTDSEALVAARLLVSSLLMENFLHPEPPDAAHVEDTVRLLAVGLHRAGETPRKD